MAIIVAAPFEAHPSLTHTRHLGDSWAWIATDNESSGESHLVVFCWVGSHVPCILNEMNMWGFLESGGIMLQLWTLGSRTRLMWRRLALQLSFGQCFDLQEYLQNDVTEFQQALEWLGLTRLFEVRLAGTGWRVRCAGFSFPPNVSSRFATPVYAG